MFARTVDTTSYAQAGQPMYAEGGGSAVFPSLSQGRTVKVAQAYSQGSFKAAALHDLAPAYAAAADSFQTTPPASAQMWDSSFIALVGVLLLAVGLRAFYFYSDKRPAARSMERSAEVSAS